MNRYAILAAVTLLALVGAGCSATPEEFTFDNTPEVKPETTMETSPSSDKVGQKIEVTPPADLLTERVETGSSSKVGPIAIMKTTFGDIKIQLFEEATPKTVENFITLAEQDFYDGTIFHRVIPDFMIQGGDPLTREMRDNVSAHGTGGPGYKFGDEMNEHKNVRGAISMANSGPNTNGSQFFLITTASTPWLDGKHAVFGEVIEGLDIMDRIEKVKTAGADHPVEDIEILDVVIER